MMRPGTALLAIFMPTPDGAAFVMRQWFVDALDAERLAGSMSTSPHVEHVISRDEALSAGQQFISVVDGFEVPGVWAEGVRE